jgi:hypothetical protein
MSFTERMESASLQQNDTLDANLCYFDFAAAVDEWYLVWKSKVAVNSELVPMTGLYSWARSDAVCIQHNLDRNNCGWYGTVRN